jgi:hypothetical protein
MRLSEYFTQQGLDIQNSLRASMAQHNRNASGKTSESIQFEVVENKDRVLFQVVADRNILALQDGRGPTVNNGPGNLKNAIRQWVKDKGIKSELPEETLVYLITRKIHREGYKGTPGLITDTINDSLLYIIQLQVAEIAGDEFVKEIKV